MISLKVIVTEGSQVQIIDLRKSINVEILRAARSALKEIIAIKHFAMRELDVDDTMMSMVPFVDMMNLEHVQIQGSLPQADFRKHLKLKTLSFYTDQNILVNESV